MMRYSIKDLYEAVKGTPAEEMPVSVIKDGRYRYPVVDYVIDSTGKLVLLMTELPKLQGDELIISKTPNNLEMMLREKEKIERK